MKTDRFEFYKIITFLGQITIKGNKGFTDQKNTVLFMRRFHKKENPQSLSIQ